MEIYREILRKSKKVDKIFDNIPPDRLNKIKIIFEVPRLHPRGKEVSNYSFSSIKLDELNKSKIYNLTKNHFFIIDNQVSKIDFVNDFVKKNKIKPIKLNSTEYEVKTKGFMDQVIEKNSITQKKDITIVAIGGGLILNVGAYIAERISSNLIQIPTTVLSMADSAGGKVRMNFIEGRKAHKHFYKSYYEPNAMYFEDRFILYLPKKQIKTGLVEIIKHGLFQSPKLYDYLLKCGEDLFKDKDKLKKAIIWSLSLKKICLDLDIEENENGSQKILRGGHNFSDKIEEEEGLKIPHGIAVAIGIIKQLEIEKNKVLLKKAIKIFKELKITYNLEDFKKTKI